MQVGEVRIYDTNGGKIWSKKIAEDLYLVNGVYCGVGRNLNMEDVKQLQEYLDLVKDAFFQYGGADNGYVVSIMEPLGNPSHYCVFENRLWDFPHISENDCEVALNEYYRW